MREIDVNKITMAVKDMCISANLELSEEMKNGDEIFNGIMDDLARNCIRIDWTPIGARDQWGLA